MEEKQKQKINYSDFFLLEKNDFIGLKVAKEEKEAIRDLALRSGLNITTLIRIALKEYFENHS